MNPEFLKPFIKDILTKGLKSGTTTMIEEFAESLNLEQLDALAAIVNRVRDKKKNVVDVK